MNTVVICLTFYITALLVLLLEKELLASLHKMGFSQHVRPDGPESHARKSGTPTAGGIIFVLVPLVACQMALTVGDRNLALWVEILGLSGIMLGSLAIGFADDYLKKILANSTGLRAWQKLLAQLLLSLLLVWLVGDSTSWSTDFFGKSIHLGPLGLLGLGFLVLAGSMNAFNLTDGVDGLASSQAAISAFGLASLIRLLRPTEDLLLLAAIALFAACVAFYKHNRAPAKLFMGDTGSFFLGGSLAGIAMMARLEWFLPLMALVPVLESVSVMVQVAAAKASRRFLGRDWRPLKMAPLHHHLELSGWSEKRVVLVLGIFQGLVAIATLLTTFLLR